MRIRDEDNDFNRPEQNKNWGECDPDWLVGAARIVYDQCEHMGFTPKIEYRVFVQREDAWFEITITK